MSPFPATTYSSVHGPFRPQYSPLSARQRKPMCYLPQVMVETSPMRQADHYPVTEKMSLSVILYRQTRTGTLNNCFVSLNMLHSLLPP